VQVNHPPRVKITQPNHHETASINTVVQYEISVADEDDGNSAFDEIQPREVLPEVKYLPAHAKQKNIPPVADAVKTRGLETILGSNCFNCHLFSEKSIGPSYFEIQKKKTQGNKLQLICLKNISGKGLPVSGVKLLCPPIPS
jgi:cytochrome c